jgi:hypothetical protein
MKVKDLKTESIYGLKVRIPKKFEDHYQGIKGDMHLLSVWNAGVWMKKKMSDDRMYPLSINPKEVLNFTVAK